MRLQPCSLDRWGLIASQTQWDARGCERQTKSAFSGCTRHDDHVYGTSQHDAEEKTDAGNRIILTIIS